MFGRHLLRNATTTSSAALRRNISRSKTVRGGHGHGDELHHYHPNKKLGPYEVPHHPTYPQEAHPFGIDFSKAYKAEGWEGITLFVYAVMFGMIFYRTRDEKADDGFKSWAKREAIARRKVIEEGGEIEFGKFYSSAGLDGKVTYEHSEDAGETPKKADN